MKLKIRITAGDGIGPEASNRAACLPDRRAPGL